MSAGRFKVVVALACGISMVGGCASRDEPAAATSAVGGSGKVRYYYDALGRLIQAAAPDGSGAHYSYDAVGNITSIRRLAAATLEVIDFDPRAGAVGTTVTIYGSGFDPVAAANAVAFNGTTAAVTAAAETALTVTVPNGATSGKITVTNTRGTATSAADYLVSGISSAPSIATFTPQIGTAGTIVTVTGANFQSNAEDDKVTMAGQPAALIKDVTSPTATLLKVTVPSTTASGVVAVTTQFGVAVSSSEFFAVPASVDPASVQFTGRLAVDGPALNVTTTVAGKKAVVLFDGHAGQQLHLLTLSGSFATGFAADVYAPDGTKAESLSATNNSAADFTRPLALDGTYSIIVSPATSDKGSVQASVVSDVSGSLAVDGSTAVSLGAGQVGHYSFTAEAGKGYGLAVTALTFTPPGSLTATLRKADGTSLATCSFSANGSCNLSPTSFASAGTYLLDFDPSGLSVVSFNALMSGDLGGTITMDAPSIAVVFARAGQNARLGFSGTAGQRCTLIVSGGPLANASGGTPVQAFKPSSPNGAPFANTTLGVNQAGLTLDMILPETGNYIVLLDPSGLAQGSLNLQLRSEAIGALAVDGATAVSLDAGQNARYGFTAEAGKGYGLALTGVSISPGPGSVTATLRSANGASLGSCVFSAGAGNSCDLDPTMFATTGGYLIDFDPSGLNAASFTVLLSKDSSGVVAGGEVTVPFARAGQNARYTFSGTAGGAATVVLRGTLDDGDLSTVNNTAMLIFKPSSPNAGSISNGTLHQNDEKFGVSLHLTFSLPETGDYTIYINPTGLISGSLHLQVTN